MLGQNEILEVRPGLRVIAVPTVWKVAGVDGHESEVICLHVARQLLGEQAELVPLGDEIYTEALELLENVCAEADRVFSIIDDENQVCQIGGETWKEAGLRWVRVVRSDGESGSESEGKEP